MPGLAVDAAGEIVPLCYREALGRAGEWAPLRNITVPLERYYDRLFKCWRHHWLLVEGLLADWPGAISFLCPHCQSRTIAAPEMDGEGQFVPLLCPVCEHSIEWEALGVL